MADAKSRIDSIRGWIVEHKLRSVGCLWLSGLAGSVAYNWSQPHMKTSVRIIHARLHAQALTLAALAGAALVEVYDHKSGAKAERYALTLAALAGAALVEVYDHKSGAKAERYASILPPKN